MSTAPVVRMLGVVGAGNMGSGIAQKMATEGFDVTLVDVDDEKVARGVATIGRTLDEGVARRVFTQAQADDARARLRGSASFDSLAEADLVVEAVFEDMAVKADVFRRLEDVCRPDAILATNTSSFAVTNLARNMRIPSRLLGLHYFYHPAKNRLVEVVPGRETSADVVGRAWSLQERIGKTPIASGDACGFIVNRFFVPWLMEAVRLLDDGVADAAAIDAVAMTTFGIGIGPFALMNVTGVPIALHAARTLDAAFGPAYTPPQRLVDQVASGAPWTIGPPPAGDLDAADAAAIGERLMGAAFFAAASLVDEGVGTAEDTDIGARVGLRWHKGPFEMMNAAGVSRAQAIVSRFADRFGASTPALLTRAALAGRPFTLSVVKSETRDGIATITINRPDAMNALNEAVVSQLRDAFRAAAAAPDVKGIVIAGAGKAFVAGADIRFFIRHVEAGTLDRIVEFTRDGQALLLEMERCPKPVVARVHGLALGGGLELALACHAIVATPKATVALPETGIGIYPALGGSQRAPRRVGRGLARWLIFTGQMVGGDEALAIGLVDRVAAPDDLDRVVREVIQECARQSRPRPHGPERSGAVSPAVGSAASHDALARLFDAHDPDALRSGAVETGGDERLARAVKRVAAKAPIALRLAASLIDVAMREPIERGLAAELDHLPEIFATRDALAGLESLGGPPPAFHGV